jgi:hypothetical protein
VIFDFEQNSRLRPWNLRDVVVVDDVVGVALVKNRVER